MSFLLRSILIRGKKASNLVRSPVARNLTNSTSRCTKDLAVPPIKEVIDGAVNPSVIGGIRYPPNALEKLFLVWSGKFKSVSEVPATVSRETMEKSRNKARIRIANLMILSTIVGCICMVISGKRAAKRGESLQKMNLEWHRQIKENSASTEGLANKSK